MHLKLAQAVLTVLFFLIENVLGYINSGNPNEYYIYFLNSELALGFCKACDNNSFSIAKSEESESTKHNITQAVFHFLLLLNQQLSDI